VGQANSIIHARGPLFAEAPAQRAASAAPGATITLALHEDLAAIEAEWRALEQDGDCTPFQSFAWLSAWQRHVGARIGTKPAIIAGRRGSELMFILPLAVERGTLTRRLTFLGQDLCDYNAPLIARDFARVMTGEQFAALWGEALALIQARAGLRHDMVVLAKMPRVIGTQANPMLALETRLHPSGAYEATLGADWEAFYNAKRSSSTRRRDRTKLKKLGELGTVRFVELSDDAVAATFDALIAQKSKAFARMGVPNMFARPGYPEFFRDLALGSRALVHISRLDVGDTWAAINLGLTFGDCYYHILASYDDGEVSRFGPGAAHLRELMHYAIRRGCRRFDFTVGDEPYKREWCETEQQLFDHSSATTLRGVPAATGALAWGHLKRAIKHSALLWKLTQRARAALGTLRRGAAPAPDSREAE
jgi:CelD/BcsL family acetyltransferase involved in cellulose biosynthesis